MRRWSLILVLVTFAGCTIRVPRLAGRMDVKTQVHVDVHARAVPLPPPPPPPPAAPAVEVKNAPVVEFFGIPLEGVTDVVFVLDCSGSMEDRATGRIAAIAPAQSAPDPGVAPAAATPDPNAPPAPDAPPPSGSEPEVAAGSATAPVRPPPAPRKIDVAKQELVDALSRLPAGTATNVLFFNNEVEGYAPSLVPLQEGGREGLIAFVNDSVPQGRTALVPAMRAAFLMNPRRIVLLSDGLGNIGGGSAVLLEDAREAIRGGVRIDAIGLGADQDARLLSRLAGESGGLYQAF